MSLRVIEAVLMQKAFLTAASRLDEKKEWINELNVFPVPDGDTGTNMTMTMMAAEREVRALLNPDMESLARAISAGSLRGARGNSGVILSQLFRGFTRAITAADRVDVVTLANAFNQATDSAYKAVMKPKEGTILTVARGMAKKALELAQETDDILEFAEKVIEYGDYILEQTPEMLPVLKQAGVVDSGGQGLMEVMKGALDGLRGKEPHRSVPAPAVPVQRSTGAALDDIETADIRFGYCTEFIINVEQAYDDVTEREFKSCLESIGDSLVVVSDEDVIKVHVHTNDPGLALQKALSYGSLSRIKIDNMREEHQERIIKESEKKAAAEKSGIDAEIPKPYGFIAVSSGAGLGEIFTGIGADYLIEGGQTMNPSTEDILNAIEQIRANTVYVLPNNKNIILAAEQARNLVKDKAVYVLPSKTIPQGITALINFAPELSPQENFEHMTAEIKKVKTGQLTYAIRDTVIDGLNIREGDIIGIGDPGMLAVGSDIAGTALDTLKAMLDQDAELVSIYYGADVSPADAEALLSEARTVCPDCEVELHYGGQPIYYYIISVE